MFIITAVNNPKKSNVKQMTDRCFWNESVHRPYACKCTWKFLIPTQTD